MKRFHILCSILLSLSCAFPGRAQYADSTRQTADLEVQYRSEAMQLTRKGKVTALTGVSMLAAAGGVFGLIYGTDNPVRGTLGIVLCSALGTAGVLYTIGSIPYLIKGSTIAHTDEPWRSFSDMEQNGFDCILDLGLGIPGIVQPRITAGYHFNRHLFWGAGVAHNPYFLEGGAVYCGETPIFTDLRYSFGSDLFSPYIGVSGGASVDVLGRWNPYLSADLGTRYRRRPVRGTWWLAVTGEVSADYRLGVKVGRSF